MGDAPETLARKPLGLILEHDLPDFLFRQLTKSQHEAHYIFGPGTDHFEADFKTICQRLKHLSDTGSASQVVLLKGAYQIGVLLDRLREMIQVDLRQGETGPSPTAYVVLDRLASHTNPLAPLTLDEMRGASDRARSLAPYLRPVVETLDALHKGLIHINRSLGPHEGRAGR